MKFIAGENARVPNDFYDATKNIVAPYVAHLNEVLHDYTYTSPESSINLISDEELFKNIQELFKEKKTRALKYVFICGIGGSNLGAKALYEAEFLFSDCFHAQKPRLIFIDTINTSFINSISPIISSLKRPNDFLLIGITKSGTTTETATNLEIFTDKLSQKFNKKDIYERTVFITDENSKLWEGGKHKKISTLPIPKNVGGRFSVFSPVGLFPLSFVDISLEEVALRAKGAREWCLHEDLNDNPAFASAVVLYYHLKQGKNISNTFLFNNELESLGKWYRQLLGESLGKTQTEKEVSNSITPIISIGSTDLHSVAQLFFGGPKDKTTTFVRMKYKESIKISDSQTFSLVEDISGKTDEQVMDALYEGTKEAYKKLELPFMEVLLDDYYDTAAFMQFKMIEVMILAHLLGENAFTQPHVEAYKIETRNILKG